MNTGIIEQCVNGTFAGTIPFPEVIARLSSNGIEWYSVNLLCHASTHYAPDGSYHQTAWPDCQDVSVAAAFDAQAVETAIRASQRREILYPEFLRRIADAGVVYYTVHFHGRKAIYFGRHGDFHVEPFPSAT